jgi:lipid-A-disaccharide synthase
MSKESRKYRVFISAAEPSADAHCAGLIAALKQAGCNIEFVGVGGAKMAEAGCELLETTGEKAAMTYNAFAHIAHYYLLIRRIAGFLQTNRPDLVIVCDSPAFNFHIAKYAKKVGLPTVFYVAPQLWAWAPWRIEKLRKCCDKLCCILPFEQEWFGTRGVEATFVGNPLFDEVNVGDLKTAPRLYSGFNPKNAKIALMPGSRAAEIQSLWRPMQQIAVRLNKKYHGISFTAVAVDDKTRQALDSTRLLGFQCKYTVDSVYQTARNCDFAIVASGSATLQTAAAACPMVIMYQSSRILWHLVGRWLVTTKYLSLVNILAQRELVPEFMPYFGSVEPIADTVAGLLNDSAMLAQTSSELIKLVSPLAAKKASIEVACIVTEMLHSASG